MTFLTLVRHGQTDWNLARRYQGQQDIPLNPEGIKQALILASALKDEQFDAIYSSDLQRAIQTAQILHEGRNVSLIKDIRLREISFGEWEGEVFQKMLAKYPERFAASRSDPAFVMAPRGESVAQVAARTASLANEINCVYPVGRVLIVAHGMTLATLICAANGIPLTEAHNIVPDNAQPVRVLWQISEKAI